MVVKSTLKISLICVIRGLLRIRCFYHHIHNGMESTFKISVNLRNSWLDVRHTSQPSACSCQKYLRKSKQKRLKDSRLSVKMKILSYRIILIWIIVDFFCVDPNISLSRITNPPERKMYEYAIWDML